MSDSDLICRLSIKKTLSYRAVFRYPISFYQLGTFLIAENSIPRDILERHLDNVLEEGHVQELENKYLLAGTKSEDWVKRSQASKNLLKIYNSVFEALKGIRWIKLLAVTGSVAAFNAKEDDDIDIFVVTQKNRVWLTRLFVVLYLKAAGVYRTICPNIFVSEEDLEWDQKRRNLYVAHEIAMMHPIINRDNMYFKFLEANSWILGYFGNFNVCLPKGFANSAVTTSKLVDMFERALLKLQLLYMRRRMTTEVANRTLIHFNKDDSTDPILKEYHKINSRKTF